MKIMTTNAESTSNSVKFTPMPVSQLLASLALQTEPQGESPNISCSSDDDSDSSFGKTVAKKPLPQVKPKNEFSTPSLKISHKDIKAFASEKKVLTDDNKENAEDVWGAHQTYPHNKNNEKVIENNLVNSKPYSSQKKLIEAGSEVKQHRNILGPHDNNAKPCNIVNACHTKTPEIPSAKKLKVSTPIIKSGIRKFTPGSGRHSGKKSIVHPVMNRDKVRCELFSQKKEPEPKNLTNELKSMPDPVRMPPPVPETPVNRKAMPASYIATPSYPQNSMRDNSKVLFKKTIIKDKKYMFIKKLGTGGSSEVYKVLEVGTLCEFAVKCVNLATDQELAQGYINEVRLLRELQGSDRVIRLYDYEYDHTNQFLRMVLEAGETDLSSFLRARAGKLPPALVLHYWEEMLHAVNYIHEHGVIHADLKPANFLLVAGRLKLIDFGIASAIGGDATSVVRAHATGTYSYISPEALMGGAGGYGAADDGNAPIKISFRSDVWSLGCILYSMVYGRTPFSHIPNLAKLTAILNPNHKIDYPPVEHLPPSLIAALKWCLTYNARARPTVRELLSISYLQPHVPKPLPQTLMDKLRTSLTPQEYSLLMSRLNHKI